MPNNRVRQARRHANLSQQALATRLGVHRSAVAQWEREGGSHPTAENCARIAIATSVSFEWLATGRGKMAFSSDILAGDEPPGVLLEYCAQSETEIRALTALRRLEFSTMLAIVEMAEGIGQARAIKLNRRVPYSR